MKDAVLVCFTAAFPLGRQETFFENELPFLASRFRKIILMPRYYPEPKSSTRSMPDNVTFVPPLVPKNQILRIFKGVFNVAPVRPYIRDFFSGQVFFSRVKFRNWVNSFLIFRINYFSYKNTIERESAETAKVVLYSYWAEAPIFAHEFFRSFLKLVRMHRIDFYLDVNGGYLPLRQQIYDASDLLLPISDDIKSILKTAYAIDEKKIFLSRLGIDNDFDEQKLGLFEAKARVDSDPIILVSCSRLDSVKRVHLIAEALFNYNGDVSIEWHHFGDGLYKKGLEIMVSEMPGTVEVVLHGWSNRDVIFDFYRDNDVTWFINVSESEGIPVSIMEAMSFGIPVIATDVGGTKEIVNLKNGHLIDKNFDSKLLLDRIINDLNTEQYSSKRLAAYYTWKKKYHATDNFNNLLNRMELLLNSSKF